MDVRAQLIEAEDGGQIVVFPPGFELDAERVRLARDGDRVVITPLPAKRKALRRKASK